MSKSVDSLIWSIARNSIPRRVEVSISEWARTNLRLVGSGRSATFDPDITPWTREPIDKISSDCTSITLVKPVQGGGSVLGEIALSYWLKEVPGGDVMYNWLTNDKAHARWNKRIARILATVPGVAHLLPKMSGRTDPHLVYLPNRNLIVQGVQQADNLNSDSIKYVINEELHEWPAGMLAKAYNRTTAFWDKKIINISNAGIDGDQLHRVFLDGTRKEWSVKCPGCSQFHALHYDYDSSRPELGGLWFDSKAAKRGDTFDFNIVRSTIHYKLPCGYKVADDPVERRKISLSGRYIQRNDHPNPGSESFTMDAVSVDYIPWIQLVTEHADAMRALRYGDIEPMKKFVQERKCQFWSDATRPVVIEVETTDEVKSRDGIKDLVLRAMGVDKQAGRSVLGDVPHYWVVIRDFDKDGNSLLVFEGRVNMDEELEEVRKSHDVEPRHVVVDCGFKPTWVFQMCARFGYVSVKGDKRDYFLHDVDGHKIRKIYSQLTMVDPFVGLDTEGKILIPMIYYSKKGISDRLDWIRNKENDAVSWRVPGDVSQEYKAHMSAEEVQFFKTTDGSTVAKWVKIGPKNDMLMCERYCMLVAEIAGVIKSQGVKHEQDEPVRVESD
jgi:hypothetical protein